VDFTVAIIGALILLPLLLGCWAVVALVTPTVLRVRDRLGWSQTADADSREERERE
jgi:hypothetical protein